MRIINLVLIAGFVLSAGAGTTTTAQDSPVWKRVSTGDDYVIDVNLASVDFGANRTLVAQIRTVLNKEESLRDNSGAKSKTRLEKVEFRITNGDYRVVQLTLLDSAGKSILTRDFDALDWKPLRPGGMMDRVLSIARPTLPFGKWKIASYRFADMGEQKKQTSEEFERLMGASVVLEAHFAQVHEALCGDVNYRSEHFTGSELSSKLGGDIRLPELQSDRVDLIYLRCESDGWKPSQSMLVKLPDGRMLMLWQGVFLTLKRA
jgi:hypothetical protein